MSLDLGALTAPLHGIDDLVDYIRAAERPKDRWLIGLEHEKIGVRKPALEAIGYHGQGGIRDVLDGLSRACGGEHHQHKENGMPIAVLGEGASVTLEPGGQLELSGAPARTLAPVAAELDAHLAEVRRQTDPGIAWLGAGYRPFGPREAAPWMPKGRYAAMKSSLGPKGRLALDMMLMTATVQVNLDWSDERDLARKVRTSTAVSPIVTALFANSPLVNGRESGYLDFRYQVWRETDAARCGLLEQMLRPGWSYRTYVDWVLDVPMLFVRDGGEYQDARGQTFRQWMSTGVLATGEARRPVLSNWVDHLTTVFPEVRVKRVLEQRGVDMVPRRWLLAMPALWVGLLYDDGAAEAAASLTARWSFADLLEFQGAVARSALRARGPGGRTALELARELVSIARGGLAAWSRSPHAADERPHLDALSDILSSGQTPADLALEVYRKGGPQALVDFWRVA